MTLMHNEVGSEASAGAESGTRDVLVIGGGPAGSTAATLLTRAGFSVTLFEAASFPRIHVGESLLPFCHGLFARLGVLDQMAAYFVRKPGVRFVSRDGSTATDWCFAHVIHDESYLAFQVDRAWFDKMLLDNARKEGAAVLEQTRVEDVSLDDPDGLVRVRTAGAGGRVGRYQGRFLIDASGREGLLSRLLKCRQPHPDLRRTALWNHWRVPGSLGQGLEQGMSVIVYLGGGDRGWAWVFPLTRDRLTVGVVLDTETLRRAKREAQGGDWQQQVYLRAVERSPYLAQLLAGAEAAMHLRVEGDYSYHSTHKYGERYAMVGDAAQFIDPIFSSGVYLAMNSAALLAPALGRYLRGDRTDPLADAYAQINGAYNVIHKLINLYYNPSALPFSDAAPVFDSEFEQHRQVIAAAHFLLSGDFFQNPRKYDEFLTFMAENKAFGKFKTFVIDRKAFRSSACVDPGVAIFPGSAIPFASWEKDDPPGSDHGG
jgi:flavin-dependent dehydrogenase